MKKKAKKKAAAKAAAKPPAKALGRRKNSSAPGKIGGRNPEAKLTWAKVGRKRLDEDQTIAELGAELKSIREKKGLALASVAKKLDVAPATIIKFEDRGYPVSIRIVHALAKHLGYKLTLAPSK